MHFRKWYLIVTPLYVALAYQPFVFSVLLKIIDVIILTKLVREDSLYEDFGAAALFITAVLWGIAWLRSGRPDHRVMHTAIKRLSYVTLALLFFFGGGEEISWGQRILNVSTPEAIQGINEQHEITLHNLEFPGIDMVIITRRAFLASWLVFVVAIPVIAALFEPARRELNRLIPVFPWWTGIPFLLNYVIMRGTMLYTIRIGQQAFNYALSEIQETNVAVLFLAAVLYIHLVALKAQPREAAEGAS